MLSGFQGGRAGTYPDISGHFPVAPGGGNDPVDILRGNVLDDALAQQVCSTVGGGTGQDMGILEACPHLGGKRR